MTSPNRTHRLNLPPSPNVFHFMLKKDDRCIKIKILVPFKFGRLKPQVLKPFSTTINYVFPPPSSPWHLHQYFCPCNVPNQHRQSLGPKRSHQRRQTRTTGREVQEILRVPPLPRLARRLRVHGSPPRFCPEILHDRRNPRSPEEVPGHLHRGICNPSDLLVW
jgi:hypothetical protein